MLIEREGIYALHVSPLNGFLVTWERPAAARNDNKDNLIVWRLNADSAERVAAFTQKQFDKAQWPTFQFTDDEKIAARMVSNEVQFFEIENLRAVVRRIRCGAVGNFAIAPASRNNPRVAVFTPEAKGKAASVRIYAYPVE